MARLLKKAGDFVLDVAAQQYKRSMTRKLNAFGEYDEGLCRSRCHHTRAALAAELPQQRLHLVD